MNNIIPLASVIQCHLQEKGLGFIDVWAGAVGTGQIYVKARKKYKKFPISLCGIDLPDECGQANLEDVALLCAPNKGMVFFKHKSNLQTKMVCRVPFERAVITMGIIIDRESLGIKKCSAAKLWAEVKRKLKGKISSTCLASCDGLLSQVSIKRITPATTASLFREWSPECFKHYLNPACGYELCAFDIEVSYKECEQSVFVFNPETVSECLD